MEIQELVNQVDRGEILRPEMQRKYVWNATQVRDLFDSLYRGYPIGSILVWERPYGDVEGQRLDVGEDAGKRILGKTQLLLDGQQRLTSLTAIIKNKDLKVRDRSRSVDVLFNVLHPDEIDGSLEQIDPDDECEEDESDDLDFNRLAFVVSTNKVANKANWISLRRVFQESQMELCAVISKALGIEPFSETGIKIGNRINTIQKILTKDIHVVRIGCDKSYSIVTDIFCRVNSAGTRLRGSDLALAQITSRWRGSLRKFEEFQEEFGDGKQLFDLGFLVRALVVFITHQCKFLTVGSITTEMFELGWKTTQSALKDAFDVVQRAWGVESFSLLSAPSLVITVAYYLYVNKGRHVDMSALHRWLLIGSVCGHYSRGSSESIMDQDLSAISKGATPEELMKMFEVQGWKGVITASDIEGKYHQSAYFGLMYLAMKAKNATDWYHDTTISMSNVGATLKIEYHHIIPKALLKGCKKYTDREINDISNLAFIGGNSNKRISDKNPEIYLPSIDETVRSAQCVPLNAELYAIDKFQCFLAERRELIVSLLNDYLASLCR